jgi:hypothetical protein
MASRGYRAVEVASVEEAVEDGVSLVPEGVEDAASSEDDVLVPVDVAMSIGASGGLDELELEKKTVGWLI